MGILKKLILYIFILLCAIYVILYFALPYFLNKYDYSKLLTDSIKDQTGLILFIHDYKLNISPTLDINLKAEDMQLFYPDNKQILDIKKTDIDISTLYLLKKEIKIDKIKAEEIQFSSKLLKNGKFTIQEYLEKNVKPTNTEFTFSKKLPKININKYIFKIKDEESGQKFKVVGKDFKVAQNLNFKYINLTTSGELYCFNKKYVSYKVKLALPKNLLTTANDSLYDISLNNLYKYNFYADVDADLKINTTKDKFNAESDFVSGKINVDNFSIAIGANKLPPSYFHIVLSKGRANLSSKIYTNKNENADISADIKTTKPYNADIKCKCKKADIANLQKLSVSLAELLKIKNNLSEFDAHGLLSADFILKTDFKNLRSQGGLEIINANISHKKVPLKISNINALIDFSNDSVKIKKSDILVNGQPLKITGSVDKNANGNLLATADNLDLNHIMNAFPTLKPQKNLTINSGKLSFSAKISGKLNEAAPQIFAVVKNFSANENNYKIKIAAKEILIDAKTGKNKYSGILTIHNLLCTSKDIPNSTNSITSDIISAKFDNKDFEINPSRINMGSAKMILSGNVKNYIKSPSADITAKGTADTELIKSFLPKTEQTKIYSKGYLPLNILIQTNGINSKIKIQALANPNNYITPVHINNFSKINTLTQLLIETEGENIKLNDISIYYANGTNSLLDEVNTLNMKEAVNVKGKILNYKKHTPQLDNIHIVTDNLSLSLPNFKNSQINFTTKMTLNGNLNSPVPSGVLILSNIDLPEYFIKAQSAEINFNKNYVNAKIDILKIKSMDISIEAVAPLDVMTSNRINYLKLTSNYVDMDYLLALTSMFKQSPYSPGVEFPYSISSGKLNIKSYKMGAVKAQNVTADISGEKNILYLKNLFAQAYGGKAGGKITYNFPYSSITADIQGRNLDAGMAARELLPKDKQVSGKLDFDSSVTMYGSSTEQQIKSLKGNANVLVHNAQLGPLGRFEHFLYAQNLISQRLIYASLASAKQAIKPKNTGYVTYLKGVLKFNNGYAYLNPVLTAGPQMSMHISGNVNLLNNNADIEILGKVSSDVSNSLGIFGSMTIKEFLDEHTKYGTSVAKIFNFCNEEIPEMDISKIPDLNPNYRYNTKNFRVLIDGDTESVKSVKSFTWVNLPGTQAKMTEQKQTPASQATIPVKTPQELPQQTTPVIEHRTSPQTSPGFLDNIPDTFK